LDMTRTKAFDPEEALRKAVNIFWTLGYEHTSLDVLMKGMGLARQGFYDTFGDMRSRVDSRRILYGDSTARSALRVNSLYRACS